MDRRSFVAAAAAAVATGAHAEPDWDGYPRVLQGPMLGYATPDTVTIWARVSAAVETVVEHREVQGPWRRSTPQKATAAGGFVVRHVLSGLKPGTEIAYRMIVGGAPDPDASRAAPLTARTAPAGPAAFRIGFGSCARLQRHPVQPIWDGLERARPDLFFWLGDNVYADTLEPQILFEEYLRQRDIPNCRRFMAGRPQFAVWDDHDFGQNDNDRRNPIREASLDVFNRVWLNPAAGEAGSPGVYFRYSYGGADFFFLDNRYHRDPAAQADTAAKTTLGAAQRAWLKRELAASRAPFKLVICGQPWNDGKAAGQESWSSYTAERADLIAFIAREKIGGVVLLSGDTHVGELNCLPHARYGAGYDLFELVSSPLAQDCATSFLNYRPIERVRQVYSGGSNAGLVDIDMTALDPTLRFTLIDTRGEPVWEPLELRASDLQPGRRSVWRDKADRVSRQRWERSASGGAYYGPN
jgi:alkaline phosphatase D